MGLLVLFVVLGALSQDISGSYVNQMVFPDVSTFYSGPQPDYSRFPLSVYDRDFVTFRLRACGEGRILIHATKKMRPRDDRVVATQVSIGGPENNMILVREPKEGPEIFNVTTDIQILDCGEMRQFWISWRNSTLKMGRGPIYQQQMLLDMKERNSRFESVDVLYFATAEKETGVWQFDDNAGVATVLRTLSTEEYTNFWKTVENHASGIIFSVKARWEAKVALGAISGQPDYEIVLGADSNQRCVIKKGNKIMANYEEMNQTDGMEFRPFWVRWDGGLVEVGVGRLPGQLAIMDYKDKYFTNVGHVGFATGSGANGEWIIKQDTENEIIVSTPVKSDGEEFDFYISAPRSELIKFYVEACSDASIIFTQDIAFSDDNTIYVTLGADGNTKTTLGTGYSPDIETVLGRGLLKCGTPLPFWASWRMGQLMIGSGMQENADIILKYSGGIVSSIMVIGFANRIKDIPADFTVADVYGDEMGFVAPPSLGYGSIWITTRQEYFQVFEVMQCGGAQLILAETLTAIPNYHYQVIFSSDGKKVTLQRNKEQYAELKEPLECMKPRTFWLSWYDNTVKLGEGHRYGEQLLVQLSSGQPYTVNALSIGNSAEEPFLLEMEMDQDNILSLKMAKTSATSDVRWFRLYENTGWLFFRLAKENQARMALSSVYQDSTAISHEISFCEDGSNNITVRKDGKILAQVSLTSPCGKAGVLQDFWMSWENGNMNIGGSKYRGQDIRLTIPFTENDPTAAIGFYPESTGDVEWQLDNVFGPEATLITETSESNMNWIKIKHNLNSMMFGVATCSEIAITLSDRMYAAESESYVLNLSNDRSHIEKGGKAQVWSKTPNLFTCGKEQYFWLTWYGGTVSAGHGDQIGQNVLLTWHDAIPSFVNAITMSTAKSQGRWRVGFMGSLPPRPKPPVPPASAGLSGGAIAGIVIGCLILVVIVTFAVYVVLRGLPQPLQRLRSHQARGTEQSFNNPLSTQQPQY